MFCKDCGKKINEKAVVCVHCGCSIMQHTTNIKSSSKNVDIRDNLILVSVIWILFNRVYWKVLPILFDTYWDSLIYKISSPMSTLIWALLPLGLAFAVFNKKKKSTAIVFGVIYLLNGLYEFITQIINS